MGANWIRGKSSLLPTNRIIGFSTQSQHSCWRGLACALSPPPGRGSRRGQPGPGVSPSQFMLGLELQLVRPGVALPQTGTALGHAGKRWWGPMAAAPPATGMWLCPLMVTPVGDTGPPSYPTGTAVGSQAPPGPGRPRSPRAGGSWGNQSLNSQPRWAGERDFLLPPAPPA